jgi:hypothetical protein
MCRTDVHTSSLRVRSIYKDDANVAASLGMFVKYEGVIDDVLTTYCKVTLAIHGVQLDRDLLQ